MAACGAEEPPWDWMKGIKAVIAGKKCLLKSFCCAFFFISFSPLSYLGHSCLFTDWLFIFTTHFAEMVLFGKQQSDLTYLKIIEK